MNPLSISNNNKNSNISKKTKYQRVEKNEHEILMDELFPKSQQNLYDRKDSVFDYSSINDYKSIFKYRSSNAMQRSNSAINFG